MTLLEEGYSQSTVSKQYVPPYRKAIRAAAESGELPMTEATSRRYSYTKRNSEESGEAHDHRALDFFKYENEKYREFAQISAERNNAKQDKLQPIDPNKFVAKTIDLLQSSNPFEMAAGLAAATGRRFSEVVDKGSIAATNAPYWVQFGGQLKKKVEADAYLAPCLIPAADVLTALKRFRKHRRIARLAGRSPGQINRSLANSVKLAVKRHFSDSGIVPILEGEAEVTIHNLRGVYGEIAVHYFCPPSQGTARFVQARLGHVISEEEFKRANATATQHYFHYYLVDEAGQHIGAKGVKLADGGQPPAIDTAEDLAIDSAAATTPEQPAIEPLESVASIEESTIDPHESVEAIATAATPETEPPAASTEIHTSEPNAIARLSEQITTLSQFFTQEIHNIWNRINDNAMNTQAPTATDTSFFTREIEALRSQLAATEQERDQAILERDSLRSQTAEMQDRMEAIAQAYRQRIALLTEIINSTPPTPTIAAPISEPEQPAAPQAEPPQIEQAIAPVKSTPAVFIAPATQPPSQTATPAQPKPKHNTAPGSADRRVEAALLAVQEWNRQQTETKAKFTITQALLQKLTGSNRPAIQRVMTAFHNEIAEHNMEHGIDSDRHNYGKELKTLQKFVDERL